MQELMKAAEAWGRGEYQSIPCPEIGAPEGKKDSKLWYTKDRIKKLEFIKPDFDTNPCLLAVLGFDSRRTEAYLDDYSCDVFCSSLVYYPETNGLIDLMYDENQFSDNGIRFTQNDRLILPVRTLPDYPEEYKNNFIALFDPSSDWFPTSPVRPEDYVTIYVHFRKGDKQTSNFEFRIYLPSFAAKEKEKK